MFQLTAPIVENVPLAERTFRVRLECPDLARRIRPGQFVMLRLPGTSDPLLGRPFALYDTALDSTCIDVVYLVVGKMTGLLSGMKAGEALEIWGPLGNGFHDLGAQQQVNLVAGGIGQTPFLAYARDLLGAKGYGGESPRKKCERVTLFYGVRSQAFAAGLNDFEAAGAKVLLATADGSDGFRGFVTQLLERESPLGPLVGCGPEPMLKSLASLAKKWDRLCHVSLETPMACGFGVCFSCVAPVKCGDEWDYKRVCVEGPVFDAATLKWDHS
jgi:dihydroorotate dehydrogenase electron transfer subunit